MTFEITTNEDKQMVVVHVSGNCAVEEMNVSAEKFVSLLISKKMKRLLIDSSKATIPPTDIPEFVNHVERMLQNMVPGIKTAVINPAEPMDPQAIDYIQREFAKKDCLYETFENERSAIDWLMRQ